jgi:Txe/YoeB family toxin of Txe-Axe toxin-antitoxin module
METLGDNFGAKKGKKGQNEYVCKKCDFKCSKKYSWERHILTAKHQMETLGDNFGAKKGTDEIYQCENCNKIYSSRNGLWKHKKCCNNDNTNNNSVLEINGFSDKELIIMLMKKNDELQSMMMEVIKNGVGNNSHNTTTTHTNSHNKAFNLNFFLNETCKDAMNIGEFVDSLKLQLSDLEKVGEAGYIEGISNIIVKNLKELDVTKRPVHCTDKKRETVYIKDNDIWEKDDDKSKMHKLIKRVVSKNMNMFPKFREVHPDCLKYHSKYSDQYNKIVYESMGGKGDDDIVKNEKIIKNVLKEVIIDKNI